MENDIFVGVGKVINTKYGEMTKISMNRDHINELIKWMKSEEKDWVNIQVCEKREKVEGKPTHYCKIDTWKPEQKQEPTKEADTVDDLPF